MITVFYDGKCGLCSREIGYYRKIAPPNIFEWLDISNAQNELFAANIKETEALRVLHAIDNTGESHTGVDAFLLIWKQLPRWRYLVYIVSIPPVKAIAKLVYKVFASWRYERLEHCKMPLK